MRRLLVLLAAVALAASFTVPAMAAEKEVSFYGRVWMDTFMVDRSKELAGYASNKSDSDLLWNLPGNGTSRFGANFKWGDMSANVEIRPYPAPNVTYRQWNATWNFGGGTLLIGHTWSPLYINATICSQCEAGGTAGGYGFWVGSLRQSMVRLTMGGLTVALVEPSTSRVVDKLGTWTGGGAAVAPAVQSFATETDTSLPKLEATYALNVGPVALVPFLGWQTYDEEVKATGKSYSIDGMVYGLTVKYPIGPGYINGQIWMSENGKQWGDLYYTGAFGGAFYDSTGDKIWDEDGTGYAIEAGMALSETMKLAVGYGHVEYENDFGASGAGVYEDPASSMYAQLEIQIAPGFWVTPEIGILDEEDVTKAGVTTEEGDLTYYGAVWKIHF